MADEREKGKSISQASMPMFSCLPTTAVAPIVDLVTCYNSRTLITSFPSDATSKLYDHRHLNIREGFSWEPHTKHNSCGQQQLATRLHGYLLLREGLGISTVTKNDLK